MLSCLNTNRRYVYTCNASRGEACGRTDSDSVWLKTALSVQAQPALLRKRRLHTFSHSLPISISVSQRWGEQLGPSKQRRSLLGVFCHQLAGKLQEAVVSFPDHDMTQNNTTTRPPVGLDRAIHPCRSVLLSNFGRSPALSAAIFVDLRVFILNFHSCVEIDDFQVEIAVTDKI